MLAPSPGPLAWICLVELTAYVATCVVLVAIRSRYERRMRLLARLEAMLDGPAQEGSGPPHTGDDLAFDAVAHAPLGDLRLLASASHASPAVMALLARSVLSRVGAVSVRKAARARRGRGQGWRRIAALRTLAFAGAEESWGCLAGALADGSHEVKGATVTLLGQLSDRRSAELLVEALRAGSFARSRIAASLDACPMDVADLIAPLLDSDDAHVRFWAIALMQRHPQTPGLDRQLIALTADVDSAVRKAAIDAVVASPGIGALPALRARLSDGTPFVRAHAARAIGRLHGASQAAALLPLLADPDWTVRTGVKETLSAMGDTIAPLLLPVLSHADEFARNGAAEVLQNIGVFERLVILEANGPSEPARARTIRLLAWAGGVRMWEGVLDELHGHLRARARHLLSPAAFQPPIVDEVA